jgi:putative membrane protein
MTRMADWTSAMLGGWGTPGPAMQERAWDWGRWDPMWGLWGAWGIGVILLMMLLFWGLIVAGFVLGIRWLIRQGRESRPDPALEILRQRYARGEIGRDEFEAKKRDLLG